MILVSIQPFDALLDDIRTVEIAGFFQRVEILQADAYKAVPLFGEPFINMFLQTKTSWGAG